MSKAGLTSLDLTFTYQNTDEYSTWAQIIQQNLKDVGINVTLNPLDSSSFWAYGEGGKDKGLGALCGRLFLRGPGTCLVHHVVHL